MDLFVDVQGFKEISANKFILKEFALVSSTSEKFQDVLLHYILKPPYHSSKINDNRMLNNMKWLTYYYHGIKWDAPGSIDLQGLKAILINTFENYNIPIIINVKGSEKKIWMEEILSTLNINKEIDIINVEDKSSAFVKKLSILESKLPIYKHCKEHTHHKCTITPKCALKNVFIIKNNFYK